MDPDVVQIDLQGTDSGVYDGGIRAQRGVHIEGRAVAWAAESMIDQLRNLAATIWKVEMEGVRWERGRAWIAGSKKRFLTLQELAGQPREIPLKGVGYCEDRASDLYSFYAVVVDVEVDSETGQVKLEQIHFAIDVTKVINPVIHQGQIDGGIMQGVGFSLMESLEVDDGRITTLNLGDYKIPNIRDVPRLTTSHVIANAGPGPFGAKAVAECGIGVIAPAIANAVYNATGVRIMDAPITSEKIMQALNEGRASH